MIVHFSGELLATVSRDNQASAAVTLVLCLIVRERHDWFFALEDDPSAFDTPALAAFQEMISKRIKRDIEEGVTPLERYVEIVPDGQVLAAGAGIAHLVAGATMRTCVPDHRISIRTPTTRVDVISTTLIEPFLAEKLQIVVENNDSDGEFFWTCYRLAKAYDQTAQCSDQPFEFVLGGGSTIDSVLRGYGGKKRAVCIIDGDFSAPGQTTNKILHEKVAAVCDNYDYDYWILQKRAIENYIPDSALLIWQTEKNCRWIGQHPYFPLSDDEKDFVEMKKKASPPNNGGPGAIPPATEFPTAASANTTAQTTAIVPLERGFGKDTWQAIRKVTSFDELEQRDASGEIRIIIALVDANV